VERQRSVAIVIERRGLSDRLAPGLVARQADDIEDVDEVVVPI
jgi:hypothetical protein